MKRRSLKDIDALLGARRVTMARAVAQKKMDALLLGQVRKEFGLTQAALARKIGVTQSALSQVESSDDMQIGTLRRIIKAMGGELDLVARFEGRSILVRKAG